MDAPLSQAGLAASSREVIEAGSKSFAGAARLLAPDIRESASLLYAWCRYCDDEIDGQDLGFPSAARGPRNPAERLEAIRSQTRKALAGADVLAAPFRALQHVARRHDIPSRYPLDLIDGFAMDVEGRRYERLDDTLLYAYRVAGAVGVMMATVMGVRDEPTLDRACDLGIAFQLTNIARDVVEDAGQGRVYLPSDWLDEAGLPPSRIVDPAFRPKVAQVTARLLDEAEGYYASALAGIARLPLRSAVAIATARAVYRAIGRKVRRTGAAAWDVRASTSRGEKLALAAGAAATAAFVKIREPEAGRTGLWTRPRLGPDAPRPRDATPRHRPQAESSAWPDRAASKRERA
ncbi:phytoene/squalene synthase family protein [Alsobacter sp. KACC 23698]|uniref:Phytoene/squalene synthase family protein n=1 Tax=Alsobacter sp. KACC 23698 TaxID=3149229 RepID=A0AAU7JLD1_9HYPH